MDWHAYYQPPYMDVWQGRSDSSQPERIHQVIQALDLSNAIEPATHSTNVVLLGFACDEGVKRNHGRPGAAHGPAAIKPILANYAINANTPAIFDAGTIHCASEELEVAQAALGEAVSLLLHYNYRPLLIGGGHEIAWGHYQGIHKALLSTKLGIINFDAHLDMRPLLPDNKGSSGTPFLQIAEHCEQENLPFNYCCLGLQPSANTYSLVNTANDHKVTMIWADDIASKASLKQLKQFINKVDAIYLTVCMDVFQQSIAPGVSAPQATGIQPQAIYEHLNLILSSNKLISYDIAELSPPLDHEQMTARLAASIAYRLISKV